MAGPYRGCLGKVKVNATTGATGTGLQAVGLIRDWNFEETAEQIDASVMGSCAKSYEAGATATTGQITAWWDADDAGQAIFVIGNKVQLRIYPRGSGSGADYYRAASATITSKGHTGGGVDGIVTRTIGFAVNGAMTATAVP